MSTSPANLAEFQARLGYQFKDEDLLVLALTHPSVGHERSSTFLHNQRLEFLGDAVLQLVLTRELYDRFPAFGEGPMTKARAQLVNRHALASRGRKLSLGDYLILSRGEEATGGRTRESAVADAFEALIGAIYVDGGFEVARGCILNEFGESFLEQEAIPLLDNPKGELQEILQANSAEAPVYELRACSGPDHDRQFECAVIHLGVELGRGSGKSKKSAESQAALAALEFLRAHK